MTLTLLAFLDDVEHNRIPADEVRHRARLARHEVERLSAPIEGVDVWRMRELLEKATPGPWRTGLVSDTTVQTLDGKVVAEVDGDYNQPDLWPIMEANAALVVFLRNNASALLSLASTLPERVAEAVMGEREAIQQAVDAMEAVALKDCLEASREDGDHNYICTMGGRAAAFAEAADAIRSRPAPAQTMAHISHGARTLLAEACLIAGQLLDSDASDENKQHARRFADQARAVLRGPSPTPPADDSAVENQELRTQGKVPPPADFIKRERADLQAMVADLKARSELPPADDRVQRVVEAWKVALGAMTAHETLSMYREPRWGDLFAALATLTPGAPDHG
jgi:hypothetical protein